MTLKELSIETVKTGLKSKLINDNICLTQHYCRDTNIIAWNHISKLPYNPLLGTCTQSVLIIDFINLFPKAFTKSNIKNKRVLEAIKTIEGKALIRNKGVKGYLLHVNRWLNEGIRF